MDNYIDRAERHRSYIKELDGISEVFMRSQMVQAHFSKGHHYLGSAPSSCKVCELRELLIHFRAELEAALPRDSTRRRGRLSG